MTKSLEDIALDLPPEEIQDRVEDDGSVASHKSASELLLLQQVKNHEADRELRKDFGNKAYKVVRKTLYGWAWVLGICGFFGIFGIRVFPDSVMIAITTAVTLNVFAAFLGVIRGLFPSKNSND